MQENAWARTDFAGRTPPNVSLAKYSNSEKIMFKPEPAENKEPAGNRKEKPDMKRDPSFWQVWRRFRCHQRPLLLHRKKNQHSWLPRAPIVRPSQRRRLLPWIKQLKRALESLPTLGASAARVRRCKCQPFGGRNLPNPSLSVEAENIYGDGAYKSLDNAELTYNCFTAY